jgi:hypothetical protein
MTVIRKFKVQNVLYCHPSARGDDVFWYRLPVNINRPLTQLNKSLRSVFFGDPSSPLQSEQQKVERSWVKKYTFPFSDNTLSTTTMSSNAPPTTTSPDRPSTKNPQDLLITPNHIPVVTQTEENGPLEHLF